MNVRPLGIANQARRSSTAVAMVDVDHIVERVQGNRRHPLRLNEVDWNLLINQMFDSLENMGDDIRFISTVYVHQRNNRTATRRNLQEHVRKELGDLRGEIAVQVWDGESVHALMASDIWNYGSRLLQWQLHQESPPYETTFMIADGSSRHAHVIRAYRTFLKDVNVNVRIKLHTFGWKETVDPVLLSQSDKVTYLEDLLLVKGKAALFAP